MSDMSKSMMKGFESAVALSGGGCSTQNLGGYLSSVGSLGVPRDPVDAFFEVRALEERGWAKASQRLGLGVAACQLVHVVLPYLRHTGVPRQVTWLGCRGRLATGQVGVPGWGGGGWVSKHHR